MCTLYLRRCKCGNCHVELLANVREYRCCREVLPAVGRLIFDGSIERIHCVTDHEEYIPLTHVAVLKQAGPLLKDKNGRSYRRRTGQNINE